MNQNVLIAGSLVGLAALFLWSKTAKAADDPNKFVPSPASEPDATPATATAFTLTDKQLTRMRQAVGTALVCWAGKCKPLPTNLSGAPLPRDFSSYPSFSRAYTAWHSDVQSAADALKAAEQAVQTQTVVRDAYVKSVNEAVAVAQITPTGKETARVVVALPSGPVSVSVRESGGLLDNATLFSPDSAFLAAQEAAKAIFTTAEALVAAKTDAQKRKSEADKAALKESWDVWLATTK